MRNESLPNCNSSSRLELSCSVHSFDQILLFGQCFKKNPTTLTYLYSHLQLPHLCALPPSTTGTKHHLIYAHHAGQVQAHLQPLKVSGACVIKSASVTWGYSCSSPFLMSRCAVAKELGTLLITIRLGIASVRLSFRRATAVRPNGLQVNS